MFLDYNSADAYVDYAEDRNSVFYQKPDTSKNHQFCLPPYNSDNWTLATNESWTYVMRNGYPLPDQGWKIHITATLEEAQNILYSVALFLFRKDISFKFVPSVESLQIKNGKYADRSGSGKFITIYPDRTDTFIYLLKRLEKITQIYDLGPYILSDKQWKSGNVFYRYGAFKEIKKTIKGKEIFCIKDQNGAFVEDLRLPSYTQPSFVKEPPYIQRNNTFPEVDSKELKKYSIKSALHFSNAGGVYLAEFEEHRVVIKEGRKNAGLGGSKHLDGFHRIRDEFNVLNQLHDVSEVVNPVEAFTIWQHNYLVEEFVEGTNLQQFITANYPFSNINSQNSVTNSYVEKCISIIEQLKDTIQKCHRKGYAICDLSLSNILVNEETYKITLIDLEAAKPVEEDFYPDISTPGFSSLHSRTFGEQDWYAFYAIANTLFLPVSPFREIAPLSVLKTHEYISTHLGTRAAEFLQHLRNEILPKAPIFLCGPFIEHELDAPDTQLSISTTKQITSAIYEGIISNLRPDSRELTAGDLNQYSSSLGNFNIANGAFGVLLALQRKNPEYYAHIPIPIKEWIRTSLSQILGMAQQSNCDFGLFTGIPGIAVAAKELGEIETANILLRALHAQKIQELFRKQNISIYSGLSGIGLFFLSQYKTLSKIGLRHLDKVAQDVRDIYKKQNGMLSKTADMGLITGWTGAALFLWKYGIVFKKESYKEISQKIMKDVVSCLSVTDDYNQPIYLIDRTRGFPRLLPYLENGSAGIILTMLECRKDENRELLDPEDGFMKGMIESCNMFCSYNAGLFSGYTGLLPVANAVREISGDTSLLSQQMKSVNLFLLKKKDSLFIPGQYGYKCSMDLSTGASGLLLCLHDIEAHGHWNSWIPLALNNDIHLFESTRMG